MLDIGQTIAFGQDDPPVSGHRQGKAGDVLRVEGVPDGKDSAAVDYLEVTAGAR